MLPFENEETVTQARARVMANLDEGIDCPCCDRWAKQYWRSIYHMQCVRMATLYRLMQTRPEEDFFALPTMDRNAHEIATLLHWELVEAESLTLAERKALQRPSRGMWRLTDKGRGFIVGAVHVPRQAVVYNDAVLFFDPKLVTVHECLKKNFSYDELMLGIPLEENP